MLLDRMISNSSICFLANDILVRGKWSPLFQKKKKILVFSLDWLLDLPLKSLKNKKEKEGRKEEGKKERLKYPKLTSDLLFGALIPRR